MATCKHTHRLLSFVHVNVWVSPNRGVWYVISTPSAITTLNFFSSLVSTIRFWVPASGTIRIRGFTMTTLDVQTAALKQPTYLAGTHSNLNSEAMDDMAAATPENSTNEIAGASNSVGQEDDEASTISAVDIEESTILGENPTGNTPKNTNIASKATDAISTFFKRSQDPHAFILGSVAGVLLLMAFQDELQLCLSHLAFVFGLVMVSAFPPKRPLLVSGYVLFCFAKWPWVSMHMVHAFTTVMIVHLTVWLAETHKKNV